MAASINTFLLLSILLLLPLLCSGGRVGPNFKSQVQTFDRSLNIEKYNMEDLKFSLLHDQGGIKVMNQRKLMVPVLDYDGPGPNPKHDPWKKPGHP